MASEHDGTQDQPVDERRANTTARRTIQVEEVTIDEVRTLLQDKTVRNIRRAGRAHTAVEAYRDASRYPVGEAALDILRDLLVDVWHLGDVLGADVDGLWQDSHDAYHVELLVTD